MPESMRKSRTFCRYTEEEYKENKTMSEEIFRKKSLDRVKSPERLDDYIRVSNPGIWLLLASVIALLVGACVWGIFGHIDSTVPATIQVKNGEAVCFVAESDITSIKIDMKVRFEDTETAISQIAEKSDDGYVCILSGPVSVPDGVYAGKVVTDSRKPLSFILN